MNCTLIIPAYCPPQTLPNFIKELCFRGFCRILLVDDGSGDACREIFDRCRGEGTVILRHSQNRGKGEALKTAFRYLFAVSDSTDCIITADCDGQHRIDDIEKMFYTLSVGEKNALYLGTRKFDKTMPFRSRFGNKTASVMMRWFCGLRLTDTQTGLRGFYRNMLPFLIDISGKRYEYETNMLIRAAREHIPIRSVEIQSVYIDDNRQSHYRPFWDSLRVTFAMAAHPRKRA